MSFINPVPSKPTIDLDTSKDGPSQLDQAIAIAEQYRSNLTGRSEEQDVLHNGALGGAFGLGVAAGVAALYGAARDLVLGLGLGAGGLAAADSVNYQRGFVDTYSAGADAMHCLIKIGIGERAVAGALDDAKFQLDLSMGNLRADLSTVEQESVSVPNQTMNYAKAALDKGAISQKVIERVRKSDGPEAALAQSIREATDQIALDVARQVRAREPSFTAIRNAVASVPAAAEAATAGYERSGPGDNIPNPPSDNAANSGGPAKAPPPAPAVAAPKQSLPDSQADVAKAKPIEEKKAKAPSKTHDDTIDPRVADLELHARDVWRSVYFINAEQHEVRTIARRQLDSCKLADGSALSKPLSIDSGGVDPITLAPGGHAELRITGGTPLYNHQWLGAEPALVRVRIVGDHAMIDADAKAPNSGPSHLAILDSSTPTQTASVSITVKK